MFLLDYFTLVVKLINTYFNQPKHKIQIDNITNIQIDNITNITNITNTYIDHNESNKIKICILGDKHVGKTTLARVMSGNKINYKCDDLNYNNKYINLESLYCSMTESKIYDIRNYDNLIQLYDYNGDYNTDMILNSYLNTTNKFIIVYNKFIPSRTRKKQG